MAKWAEVPRSISMTIKITPQQKEELMKIAATRDCKVSYLAYEVIKDWLEGVEKNDCGLS